MSFIIEAARDASLGTDNYAHKHILDIALDEQFDIYEEIEKLY